MNGLTQSTTAKILALKEPTEIAVLQIVDAAMEEALKPHVAEVANCHRLVNETSRSAATEVNEIASALSDKQNEIISLRAQLEDAHQKVILAANTIGQQLSELQEFRAMLEAGKNPPIEPEPPEAA